MESAFYVGIIALLISVFVSKILVNWYFNINKRDRMLKAQTLFLECLCEKMGVEQSLIDSINSATDYKKIKLEK